MSLEATPNPEGQADTVSDLTGSEDEAIAAFNKRAQPADQATNPGDEPEDQPDPADEPDADADTEADEADPDAEPEADELVEVEIGGKTFKVPAEVEKAVLRQSDYSRKMNEVGAKEKAFTERLELIDDMEKTAEKRVEHMAEIKAIDKRIKAFDGVDWAKARASDPANAALAAVELMELRQQRQTIAAESKSLGAELSEGKRKLLDDKRADMNAALQKDLKGWGDELGTKVTKFAISLGYTPADIGQITDPKWVIAMDKARRYDELQASKTAIKAKAQDAPPVAKPGAPRRSSGAQDATARFAKSKSPEDAVALFMARAKRG
ncbi:MAG: hypothetical protein V4792_09760 [Pseudomonadota bacterium]